MEMSPQRVRTAEFKTVRKGADLDEVQAFLNEVADELERAQNQSTAMEARARAAVARLQEIGDSQTAAAPPEAPVEVAADQSETISRTLLLAQRTADTTVAEARREAEEILRAANDEAAATRDSTREMAAQMVEEARTSARQAGEAERVTVAGEVDALKARRDFLESDVEQLELFLVDQRNRVREAATSLLDLADRVPGGLGEVRAPLLSASDDDTPSSGLVARSGVADASADDVPANETDAAESWRSSSLDALADVDDAEPDEGPADDDLLIVADLSDREAGNDDDEVFADGEPTAVMPAVDVPSSGDDSDGFRFTFDDER